MCIRDREETAVENIGLTVSEIFMNDRGGERKKVLKTGEAATVCICYQTTETLEEIVVGVEVFNDLNVRCYSTNTFDDTAETISLKSEGTLKMHMDKLMPVSYTHLECGFFAGGCRRSGNQSRSCLLYTS